MPQSPAVSPTSPGAASVQDIQQLQRFTQQMVVTLQQLTQSVAKLNQAKAQHTVSGQAVIGGGGTVAVNLSPGFKTKRYFVATGNTTAARAVSVTINSFSTFTISGTAGDVIHYIATGV